MDHDVKKKKKKNFPTDLTFLNIESLSNINGPGESFHYSESCS